MCIDQIVLHRKYSEFVLCPEKKNFNQNHSNVSSCSELRHSTHQNDVNDVNDADFPRLYTSYYNMHSRYETVVIHHDIHHCA